MNIKTIILAHFKTFSFFILWIFLGPSEDFGLSGSSESSAKQKTVSSQVLKRKRDRERERERERERARERERERG